VQGTSFEATAVQMQSASAGHQYPRQVEFRQIITPEDQQGVMGRVTPQVSASGLGAAVVGGVQGLIRFGECATILP
jgi:hypothetical protein